MKIDIINEDSRQFAAFLLAARVLWRCHRDLVEADSFPAEFMGALEGDVDPDSADCSEYHCQLCLFRH